MSERGDYILTSLNVPIVIHFNEESQNNSIHLLLVKTPI